MTAFLRAAVLVLTSLLLSGCVLHYHTDAPRKTLQNGTILRQHYFHAEVEAADGTKIRMTVYQPRIRSNSAAPLLIHTHGFGLGRMKRPVSLYGKVLLAGEVAQQAWKDGYYVISIDQRGHGASQGDIGLIRPDKEAEDISRVIDWAVRHLKILTDNNDPLVGMIGESYGGGVQLLASVQDPRIDALVPITTWFNLDAALFPNGVPKTSWMIFLGMVGYTMNPLSMDNQLTLSMLGEMRGRHDPHMRAQLRNNSLMSHCGNGKWPKADALLIPGMRDVLFPLNHALDTQRCFKLGGRDVRLVAVADGHLMPTAQWSPGLPIWHVQKEVTCNGQTLQTRTLIRDWLDGKLRGDAKALARVPSFCLSGDETADARLQIGEFQPMPKVHLGSGLSGQLEWLMRPLDHVGNWFVPARLPKNWEQPKNGWLRPARVPLYAASERTIIAGVPRIELNFSETDRDDPVLYLRLAKWRPGSGSYHVLNQQVTPAHGKGPMEFELGGVNAVLEKGEVLGLLVTGWNNQFRFAGSGYGTDASIEGRIALPLVRPLAAPSENTEPLVEPSEPVAVPLTLPSADPAIDDSDIRLPDAAPQQAIPAPPAADPSPVDDATAVLDEAEAEMAKALEVDTAPVGGERSNDNLLDDVLAL
ncbi:MAG: CocE/NonD family hydrolase [Moraxellaceae bacterium]|nr:CocE/NonD family hydrolase [Moraxellaceae bacterium]